MLKTYGSEYLDEEKKGYEPTRQSARHSSRLKKIYPKISSRTSETVLHQDE